LSCLDIVYYSYMFFYFNFWRNICFSGNYPSIEDKRAHMLLCAIFVFPLESCSPVSFIEWVHWVRSISAATNYCVLWKWQLPMGSNQMPVLVQGDFQLLVQRDCIYWLHVFIHWGRDARVCNIVWLFIHTYLEMYGTKHATCTETMKCEAWMEKDM
jgi:hypothetical protein